MSGLMSQKLDELFAALLQNLPITTSLIQQAKLEYDRIREVAIQGEKNRVPGESMKCPNCKKDLPLQRQTKLIESENEITRLRQELHLKITMCQDLEDKIKRLQSMQKGRNSSVGGAVTLQISEMYSRLFAEQWLQAYEFMDNNLNQREDRVLDILQRILRAAYEFCKDISNAQMRNVEGEIFCPLSTWTEDKRMEFAVTPRPNTSSSISHLARQYRDMASSECIPILQETFLKEVLPEFLDVQYVGEPVVISYTKKCVEVTWYMCIQSPPLHLITKVVRKSAFDTNLFSYYTVAGDKIDFVVWPSVVQGDDEKIISKGVAQAMDNNRSHSSLKTSIHSRRTKKSPSLHDNIPQQLGNVSPAHSLNNPALRGTPWGSQFFTSNRGTPSVDLPPTPTEDPLPTSPNDVTKGASRASLADQDTKEPARSRQGRKTATPQNPDTEQAKSQMDSVDKQKSPVPQSQRGTTQGNSRYSPPLETSSLTDAWRKSRTQPMSRPGKM